MADSVKIHTIGPRPPTKHPAHVPPAGEPQIVWRRTVVVPGEWPERADHGCSIQGDQSVPDEPIIWNVRHHRCRGFDARTGEMVSSLVYQIGGGQRRWRELASYPIRF